MAQNEEDKVEEELEAKEKGRRDKEQVGEEKGIIGSEIVEEMEKAYLDYAMSVIVQRALPSVEDGLKPVHRRILYSMHSLGLDSSKSTRKSATIVGDVIGKYHPHGDVAVYDALVRLAQNFSLRYPLVHGQGNFGCFTADTEVMLADGRKLSFADLITEHNSGKRNFTFTIDSGEIKIAEIKSPRKTRENAELIKVTLDNGEEIKCTLNHKFMLRDGSYCEAKDLKSGDSLMPLYFRLSNVKDDPNAVGYTMVFQPDKKQWKFAHVLSDEWNLLNGIYQKESGRIRHHVDFNKLNNNPDNIRRMHWKEHWQTHYNVTSSKHKNDAEYVRKLAEGRKKFWSNQENRDKYSQRLSERNSNNWKNSQYREKMRVTLSENNKRYLSEHPEVIEQIKQTAKITMTRLWKIPEYKELFHRTIAESNKRRLTNMTGKKKFVKICTYLKQNSIELNEENFENARINVFDRKSFTSWGLGLGKYYNNDKNLLLCELNGNHKVVKTEIMNETADVFDLTIDKTHNFALGSGIFVHNSLDGDAAAAYRYTEAKMSKISQTMTEDLEKETVKMLPNFDNTLKEPEILPALLPNLLINGSTGIAVGMATNIPPHNLSEVCDAIIAQINKPEITIEQLSQIVQGPDFPTGGVITKQGLKELYETGKGRVVMRARTKTEEHKGRQQIVVTEIPYMVNKADLVKDIARLATEKKLPDVSDLRDESNKEGIRIVIELKKDSEPKYTLNKLFKLTNLQNNFDANMLALVANKPRVLSLKEILAEYIKHRQRIIRKRSEFDLKKAKDRLEIVLGLLLALKQLDAIIDFIRKSENASDALHGLVSKFGLSERQAKAVLEIRLQQITKLEAGKLKQEESELRETIKLLETILGNEQEILGVIKKEVQALKKQYGDERRTHVIDRIAEISEKDMVEKKNVVVTLTESGYIKRLDVDSYREQKRGGAGVTGAELKEEDVIKVLLTCSTHDYMLFFTNRGRVFWLKAHEIPASERQGKGRAIANLLTLRDEVVTNILALKDMEKGAVFFATKNGIVKKTAVKDLGKPRSTGVRVINLPGDGSDTLVNVRLVNAGDEVLMFTREGQAIRFNEDEVREMGRSSYGVKGIELDKKDYVVAVEVTSSKEATIMTITDNGFGKRSALDEYRKTARAGKGVINLAVSDKTGNVVDAIVVGEKDSIIATTVKGMVLRTSVDDLRVMGRATQGVHIIRLKDGDKVVDVVKVSDDDVKSEESK